MVFATVTTPLAGSSMNKSCCFKGEMSLVVCARATIWNGFAEVRLKMRSSVNVTEGVMNGEGLRSHVRSQK